MIKKKLSVDEIAGLDLIINKCQIKDLIEGNKTHAMIPIDALTREKALFSSHGNRGPVLARISEEDKTIYIERELLIDGESKMALLETIELPSLKVGATIYDENDAAINVWIKFKTTFAHTMGTWIELSELK
jgi:hypothetical protein